MNEIATIVGGKRNGPISILVSLCFLCSPVFAEDGSPALKPGYFMCKDAPLQLRWFTRFDSSTEFMDAGASTNAPLSTSTTQARNALNNGWCVDTEGMEYFSINRIEPCDDVWDQIPNGGCIKVTVSPQASSHQSSWYTFRNALSR